MEDEWDARQRDFCQMSERMFAELVYELMTCELTARVNTDLATGALFKTWKTVHCVQVR